MPMSVTYATVNGRLMEETRNGVVTRYIPDTLGNVIKTADANGNITSETTYWPFGEIRTQTGTNPSPWGFCGIWGYLQDTASRLYVRARFYRQSLSRWMTVDPLWPSESAYTYASSLPTMSIDPSGEAWIPVLCTAACITTGGCVAGALYACGGLWGTPDFWQCLDDFISSLPAHSQIGCISGILGCLGCIVYYVRNRGRRCCTQAVKESLDGLKKKACDIGKRTCQGVTDCAILKQRLRKNLACLLARLAVMWICYSGGDNRHWREAGKVVGNIKYCLEQKKRIPRCIGW